MNLEYPIYVQSRVQCGPASLRGLFKHLKGIDYGETYLSFLTGANKEGCGPEEMERAAKELGFFVLNISEGGTLPMLERLTKEKLFPLVCYTDMFYEDEHWATVLSVDSSVIIADTKALGIREIPKKEFYDWWTLKEGGKTLNTTLIITPDEQVFVQRMAD
ncbi:MAG: cysteine peptidase family C39 domain-containing protein [archaeon]